MMPYIPLHLSPPSPSARILPLFPGIIKAMGYIERRLGQFKLKKTPHLCCTKPVGLAPFSR